MSLHLCVTGTLHELCPLIDSRTLEIAYRNELCLVVGRSCVQWDEPVLLVTWEAETGALPGPRSLKLAQAI